LSAAIVDRLAVGGDIMEACPPRPRRPGYPGIAAVPVQFQHGGDGVFCGLLLIHDAAGVAQVLPVQHAGDLRDTGTVRTRPPAS
jgi:hypothetical protein